MSSKVAAGLETGAYGYGNIYPPHCQARAQVTRHIAGQSRYLLGQFCNV